MSKIYKCEECDEMFDETMHKAPFCDMCDNPKPAVQVADTDDAERLLILARGIIWCNKHAKISGPELQLAIEVLAEQKGAL